MKKNTMILALACCSLTCPLQAVDKAPPAINSITLDFKATKATYPDDLGAFRVALSKADLTTGSFRYSKLSPNEGQLAFKEWDSYSGAFRLTFVSPSEGTFLKNYKGPYTGYISGTFRIVFMDVPGLPVANNRTVYLKPNTSKTLQLPGVGRDLPKSRLKYVILQRPRLGSLNASKLPTVTYRPKGGFKGTETLTYLVKEGTSQSKPGTIKFVVR